MGTLVHLLLEVGEAWLENTGEMNIDHIPGSIEGTGKRLAPVRSFRQTYLSAQPATYTIVSFYVMVKYQVSILFRFRESHSKMNNGEWILPVSPPLSAPHPVPQRYNFGSPQQ